MTGLYSQNSKVLGLAADAISLPSTEVMSEIKLKEAIQSKRLYLLGVFPIASTILAIQPVQAVSLSLLPAVKVVFVGDRVAINVQISDLGNFQSPSLSGFDLDVTFNPSVLS